MKARIPLLAFTAPIATEGLLKGHVMTFHLSGWSGSIAGIPTWASVLAGFAACGFALSGARVAALIVGFGATIHMLLAVGVLASEEKAEIGPGLVISIASVLILLWQLIVRSRGPVAPAVVEPGA